MRKIFIFTILMLSLAMSGCMKDLRMSDFTDDAISSTINVTVAMPAGYTYSVEGMVIKLSDPSTGLQFSGTTNAAGVATIKVAHGSYVATTDAKITDEDKGFIFIFNGTSSKIRVTPSDAKTVSVGLPLNVSKTGQVIIKELYYGGCLNPLTGKAYSNDKYIILYNNSDKVAYLDSLCVGMVDPFNAPTSGKTSNWVKTGTTELRDSVPNSSIGWIFGGTGTSHPLNPGEQVVISINGIDHTIAAPNSVNLGVSGYWVSLRSNSYKRTIYTSAWCKPPERILESGNIDSICSFFEQPCCFHLFIGREDSCQVCVPTHIPGIRDIATLRNFDCLMVDKNLVYRRC